MQQIEFEHYYDADLRDLNLNLVSEFEFVG